MSIQIDALSLDTLALLDAGIVNQMFRVHCLRIARDAADRPGDKSARVLTLTISVKPVLNQKGEFDHCKTEMDVKSKLPVHRTKVYQMKASETEGLLFNADYPDAIDQMPLPGMADADLNP